MARLAIVAPALLALGLTACGDEPAPPPPRETDPAVMAALDDQILADPDLSRQNEGNAALTGGIDHALPLPNRTERALDAARDEARALVGGRDAMLALPRAGRAGDPAPLAATLSIVARAAFAGASEVCVGALAEGFEWAGRMPESFPIYPRGAVQEAAGADGAPCALRAVNFRTPIPAEEVLAFYHTRARAAGYSSALAPLGEERVLRGRKGDAWFAVYAREDSDGTTVADLVVSGT